MAVFTKTKDAKFWIPTPLANGPFKGLQGGAVAGLLVAEIESQAAQNDWGVAISASAWFLGPVPSVPLVTSLTPVTGGRRVAVVDNSLFVAGQSEPCATVRVTLMKTRPTPIEGWQQTPSQKRDPSKFKQLNPKAPHGGEWFMDVMDVRRHENIGWFGLKHDIVDGAGPLSKALGPADWAHGINRPKEGVIADPNPNLSVHLFRNPEDIWVGVDSDALWDVETGVGMGGGALHDVHGVFGRVAMSVALTPFPKN